MFFVLGLTLPETSKQETETKESPKPNDTGEEKHNLQDSSNKPVTTQTTRLSMVGLPKQPSQSSLKRHITSPEDRLRIAGEVAAGRNISTASSSKACVIL